MASCNDWRASNSVGLGGMVPPGSRSRWSVTPEGRINEDRSVVLGEDRYRVMPFSLCEMLNTLFKPGLRMSSPTMITFFPSRARLTARLDAINVFPSPLMVEVMRITFWSGSPNMNNRLVRMLRKVSAMMSLSFSRTAMACLFPVSDSVRGTSPIMGTVVSFSTSLRPSMRKLSRFRT